MRRTLSEANSFRFASSFCAVRCRRCVVRSLPPLQCLTDFRLSALFGHALCLRASATVCRATASTVSSLRARSSLNCRLFFVNYYFHRRGSCARARALTLFSYGVCVCARIENIDIFFVISFSRARQWLKQQPRQQQNKNEVARSTRSLQVYQFLLACEHANPHTHTRSMMTINSINVKSSYRTRHTKTKNEKKNKNDRDKRDVYLLGAAPAYSPPSNVRTSHMHLRRSIIRYRMLDTFEAITIYAQLSPNRSNR